MTWLTWSGLALCTFAAAAWCVRALGSARWAVCTRALTYDLDAARIAGTARSASPSHYDSRDLQGLPAPVQRYVSKVLKDGQPIARGLVIQMTGTINMSSTGER